MAIKHSVKRGVATAGGGVLVIGAGMAVGVLAADMHASWSAQDALQAASKVQTDTTLDLTIPRPVVITRTVEEHVTPEPVIVHRKVYRTVREDGGSSASTTQRRAPSRTTSTTPRRSTGSSTPSRTVVTKAPAAPAPAAAKAPAASTTKTS